MKTTDVLENGTVSRTNNDAETRLLNVKAKEQAKKDSAELSAITKTADVETKAKKVTEKKVEKAKKEHVPTFADAMDATIKAGGKWADIVTKLQTTATEMKISTKINISVLKAHVNYRKKRNPQYLGNFVMTDDGIVKAKK